MAYDPYNSATDDSLRRTPEDEGARHGAQGKRICPTCHTTYSCAPSHVRNFGEQFVAVFLPFLRPFRCYVCNWRGLMGSISIIPARVPNIWINGALFAIAVTAVVILLVSIFSRSSTH